MAFRTLYHTSIAPLLVSSCSATHEPYAFNKVFTSILSSDNADVGPEFSISSYFKYNQSAVSLHADLLLFRSLAR